MAGIMVENAAAVDLFDRLPLDGLGSILALLTPQDKQQAAKTCRN